MSVLNYVLSKKEQEVHFKTKREMKVRKGREPIQKVSTFYARVGMVYDELPEVIEARESGELPKENQGLPWGTWKEFPYLIEHKDELYLRCTKAEENKGGTVHYYRGDLEITREEAREDCLASEFAEKKDESPIFNIKVSSILEADDCSLEA